MKFNIINIVCSLIFIVAQFVALLCMEIETGIVIFFIITIIAIATYIFLASKGKYEGFYPLVIFIGILHIIIVLLQLASLVYPGIEILMDINNGVTQTSASVMSVEEYKNNQYLVIEYIDNDGNKQRTSCKIHGASHYVDGDTILIKYCNNNKSKVFSAKISDEITLAELSDSINPEIIHIE